MIETDVSGNASPAGTLSGKVGFITGGVSGIGLGFAHALLAAGMKVVVTYMQTAHLHDAMQRLAEYGDHVHAMRLDVTDRSAVCNAAEETAALFGSVHLICNNAGVSLFGPMDEATNDDWEWVLGVNLRGPINVLHAFLPRMKAKRAGHVVNVASMAAMIAGPEAGVYATSKFALRGMSECLRYCLAPYGIGVSLVCPGLVNTNIHASDRNRPVHLSSTAFSHTEEVRRLWRETQLLGMEPREVGRRILRGVQQNDFFIFPHPELRSELEEQFTEIVQAFPVEEPDERRMAVVRARRRTLEARKKLFKKGC